MVGNVAALETGVTVETMNSCRVLYVPRRPITLKLVLLKMRRGPRNGDCREGNSSDTNFDTCACGAMFKLTELLPFVLIAINDTVMA